MPAYSFLKNPVQYRNAKTDRKEEKLCFAESEKMIHAGVEAGSHIVSAIWHLTRRSVVPALQATSSVPQDHQDTGTDRGIREAEN